MHGCTSVELELRGKKYATDVVVVSSLTSEGILGLDFLREQKAIIDLAGGKLHLTEHGYDIPLGNLNPLRDHPTETSSSYMDSGSTSP